MLPSAWMLPASVSEESVLSGLGVSFGIAIGTAYVYNHKSRYIPKYSLTSKDAAENELSRLQKARELTKSHLIKSIEALPKELQGQAAVIEAHLLLLEDPLLIQTTREMILNRGLNAEQAVIKAVDKFSSLFQRVQDPYISTRINDLEMLGHAVIDALVGKNGGEMPTPPAGSILVVHDISPTEIAKLTAAKVAGLATESGGATSHTALVAQALDLPAVVGITGLLKNVTNGETIILDGRSGHIIIKPNNDVINFYRARQKTESFSNAEIVRCSHLPATTLDDRRIEVLGNLELLEEAPNILSYGGEGIGLYRTEYMYLMRESVPDEEELYQSYREVIEMTAPKTVTLRTLDIGYDKDFNNGRNSGKINESHHNKALGLRGIRYSFRYRGMFKSQLRAMLRAAVHGEVRIMLPMISSLEELRRSKALLSDAARSLADDGLKYVPSPPLGIMIEVPATIFMARELAEEADFFSVGTNDLIQYSLAVDRGDPEVSELYQPLHPGILRMIKMLIDVCEECSKPVSFCGDMSAGLMTAPILIGLGAKSLSMPATAIPKIKRIIRMSCYEDLKNWADAALNAKTSSQAIQTMSRNLRNKFPEML